MELLPVELISQIADLLPLRDFRAFRLTSTKFAYATLPLIAQPHFKGLPLRDDVKRLSNLSKIPQCARRIHTVYLNKARVGDPKSYRFSEDPPHWLPLEAVDGLEEGGVFLDRSYKQDIARPEQVQNLLAALEELKNVDSITFTWAECPWKDPISHRIFDRETSIILSREEIIITVQDALETLRCREVPMKSLTIEPYPLTAIELPLPCDPRTRVVFGSITELSLMFDYAWTGLHFPHEDLKRFLSLTPNLKKLTLNAILSEKGTETTPFLPDLYFPHLEALHMQCLSFELSTFMTFLKAHAPTLRYLDLSSLHGFLERIGDQEITWDVVFYFMRDTLGHLDRIELDGRFSYAAERFAMFFDANEPRMAGSYESVPWATDKQGMEKFILAGGDYPVIVWDILTLLM